MASAGAPGTPNRRWADDLGARSQIGEQGERTVVIFSRKQRAVEHLISAYVEQARNCVRGFVDGLESWLTGRGAVQESARRVREAESRADDVRRELCLLLYGKALFPESRGDILGLIEAMDKVPNRAEASIHRINNECIERPPRELTGGFRALGEHVHACTQVMFDAASTLFTDYQAAIELSDRVDRLESAADHAERELIELVFGSGLDGFDKIIYRDVTIDVGGLADRAEDAADRIRIMAVKRKT